MAYAFILCTGNFLHGHLRSGWAKLYGGCAEVVKNLCNASAVSADSAWKSYGAGASSVQMS